MVIAVEHAGAERGLLILPRGDQLWIKAEATAGLKTVEVNLRQALAAPWEPPLPTLQYVIRTQEPVISDDALREKLFSTDEYVASRAFSGLTELRGFRLGCGDDSLCGSNWRWGVSWAWLIRRTFGIG